MKKLLVMALYLFVTFPLHAADQQINYVSQPDQLTVFLNNIAFARDTLSVPGGSDVRIVLPAQIFQDTLIVRENGERVSFYRISSSENQLILEFQSTGIGLTNIALEYLTAGISWTPIYDMAFSEDSADSVTLDFYAQIQNDVFSLDYVHVTLAAGRVDTSQQVDALSNISANQYIAGYQNAPATANLATGAVTIQHVYRVGGITGEPGETLYVRLMEGTLAARRLLLWNASADQQASVIYKVRNQSDVPLSEGIVRSYQDGLFVGSDMVEFTPIGSEGSITVGHVQDLRVNRADSTTYQDRPSTDADMLHEVTLTLSSFSQAPINLDVVDSYPDRSTDFTFSQEPQREAGNLLRWTLTVAPGDTLTITYQYYAPS
jgi:uncharacterized protein DUF4139